MGRCKLKENNLLWIQSFYLSVCKKLNLEENEYDYDITITTCDNPGWIVTIYLEDIGISNKEFKKIFYDKGKEDWLSCKVENNVFIGAGDPTKLDIIIQAFRDWIEQ